jgi:hypothetical protein
MSGNQKKNCGVEQRWLDAVSKDLTRVLIMDDFPSSGLNDELKNQLEALRINLASIDELDGEALKATLLTPVEGSADNLDTTFVDWEIRENPVNNEIQPNKELIHFTSHGNTLPPNGEAKHDNATEVPSVRTPSQAPISEVPELLSALSSVLLLFLDRQDLFAVVGDLQERYAGIAKKQDGTRANRWFWHQLLTSLPPLAWAQIKRSFGVNKFMEWTKRMKG